MALDKNDIPRNIKMLAALWPAIVLVGSVAVHADARMATIGDRVDYIWANGAPPTEQRLARIDERQQLMAQTLERMEEKIDDIDERTAQKGAH